MFFFSFGFPKRYADRILSRGQLTMGTFENIECANVGVAGKVLRLVSINSFFGIVGISPCAKDAISSFTKFLTHPSVRSTSSNKILDRLSKGYTIGRNGAETLFVDSRVITDFCRLMLSLRASGKLADIHLVYAGNCEQFMLGLADTGLAALIDEATGYRKRQKDEYRRLFRAFISEYHSEWVKEFQDSFFDGIYKVYHLIKSGKNHPSFFGAFINKYVYFPLANSHGAILEKLREKDPIVNVRGRKYKLHQFLTKEVGKPALRKHLIRVETLLMISSDKGMFKRHFKRAFPQPFDQLEFELGDDI